MNLNHERFLHGLYEYVKANPEIAVRVGTVAQEGVNAALAEAQQHAVALETALAISLSSKFKGWDQLIMNKLQELKGKTCFQWDWYFDLVSKKVPKSVEKPL